MMNRYFIFCCLFLPGVYSQAQNTRLEEAMRWIPASEDAMSFDNWTQIKEDFGFTHESYTSMKWRPQIYTKEGEEILSERFKDDFMPYASGYWTMYTVISGTIEKIGLRYPDLEWEACGRNSTHLFKFYDHYDRRPLDSLLAALEYQKEEYKGYTIFSHKHDPEFYQSKNSQWFQMCCTLCYIESEKILITSPFIRELKMFIDARETGQNYLSLPGAKNMLSQFEKAESVCVSKTTAFYDPARLVFGRYATAESVQKLKDSLATGLGLSKADMKTIHKPELWAVSEEKNGKVKSVLYYKKAKEAAEDLEKRLRIFQKGKFFGTGVELNKVFLNPKAAASGQYLLLDWYVMPYSTEIKSDLLYDDNLPWLFYY